jgi:hypothetical protein
MVSSFVDGNHEGLQFDQDIGELSHPRHMLLYCRTERFRFCWVIISAIVAGSR